MDARTLDSGKTAGERAGQAGRWPVKRILSRLAGIICKLALVCSPVLLLAFTHPSARSGFATLLGDSLPFLALLGWMSWSRAAAERKMNQLRRERDAAEDRFQQIFDNSPVGMEIVNLNGSIVAANRKSAQLLGYEPQQLSGRKTVDFLAPDFREEALRQYSSSGAGNSASSGLGLSLDQRLIRKDGASTWVRSSLALLKPAGGAAQWLAIRQDIAGEKEASNRIAYLESHDSVTGLLNCRSFEASVQSAMRAASGGLDSVALLAVEIDNLEFLEATFGRQAVEELLRDLGARLAVFRNEGETIGRLDDRVFGMLVTTGPYDDAAQGRAAELREVFRRAGQTGQIGQTGSGRQRRLPVSVSVGIAYAGQGWGGAGRRRRFVPELHATDLLQCARAAMKEAREQGGDTIVAADARLPEKTAERNRLAEALVRALDGQEFHVAFQPQFDLGTGELARFEALCRWTSPELGQIPPAHFFPIAEQAGVSHEIGRRFLLEALRHAALWNASGEGGPAGRPTRKIGLSVNVATAHFLRPEFPATLQEALAYTGLPAALVELEIDEEIFARAPNLALGRIRELQRMGLSVCLDNFGAGFLSPWSLQRMPVDAVKLDRSLVCDARTDGSTVNKVRSLLAAAKSLQIRGIAEGVETEAQLETMRAMGWDQAQGYLLGRPETGELALERLFGSWGTAVESVA